MQKHEFFTLRRQLVEIEPDLLPRSPLVAVDFVVCVIAAMLRIVFFVLGSFALTLLFVVATRPAKLGRILRQHFDDFKEANHPDGELTV